MTSTSVADADFTAEPEPDAAAQTGQTHWLSDEQQRVWRLWLHGTARVNDYLDAQLRGDGLDLGDYEILVTLSEGVDRSMRMSDLADGVHQSRSRLTHAIKRMERDGLVTRRAAEDDRRGVIATLTDDGYDLLVRSAPGHVTAVRQILVDAVAPEDFEAVGRVMSAVLSVPDWES